MNCKPGDLARVINSKAALDCGFSDKILKVTKLSKEPNGIFYWEFCGPALLCRCGCCGLVDLIADDQLRPIRDPGDDATDEMIVLLGKPEKETV